MVSSLRSHTKVLGHSYSKSNANCPQLRLKHSPHHTVSLHVRFTHPTSQSPVPVLCRPFPGHPIHLPFTTHTPWNTNCRNLTPLSILHHTAISSTLQAQHATFVALASKTAALDAELQKIKALYTQLWRAKTGSRRDPFNELDRGSGVEFGLDGLGGK